MAVPRTLAVIQNDFLIKIVDHEYLWIALLPKPPKDL
jgi:hypothetical protein